MNAPAMRRADLVMGPHQVAGRHGTRCQRAGGTL